MRFLPSIVYYTGAGMSMRERKFSPPCPPRADGGTRRNTAAAVAFSLISCYNINRGTVSFRKPSILHRRDRSFFSQTASRTTKAERLRAGSFLSHPEKGAMFVLMDALVKPRRGAGAGACARGGAGAGLGRGADPHPQDGYLRDRRTYLQLGPLGGEKHLPAADRRP